MKRILFVLVALFISSNAFSQNVLNILNNSNAFFELMEEKKFNEAHNLFADSVKTQITEENLTNLWTNVQTNFGATQSIDISTSQKEGDYFRVLLEGKFQNAEQNFVLVFNKEDKVVGFFMPPNSRKIAYYEPAYADSTLYKEEYVYVASGKYQLAAVLTTPKEVKNFPMVVLVHGSGPADMDGTVGPNKPLKDLAVGLAAKGIGTLRYVKRTLVHGSDFTGAYTVKEEVLDDALAAVELAKKTPNADSKQIYVLGHSLGGMLAPRLASLNNSITGVILAAAPARKLSDISIDQNKYLFSLANDTTARAQQALNNAITLLESAKFTSLEGKKADSLVLGVPASYWVDLNSYNQVETAKLLPSQRILVVQGGNDFQVFEEDFNLWKQGLSGKNNAKFLFYPGINHLLSQQVEKGNPQQYQTPSNVSETLINDISEWIKNK